MKSFTSVVILALASTVFANNDSVGGLSLNPKNVNSNAKQSGHNASAIGQSDSITSTNNFINFCTGKVLTNGQQVKTGSCNGIVMGAIPNTNNIPTAKFQSPKNLDTITANQNFTVQLKINNMQTGDFTNAELNYYGAPQQLNSQGQIIGHTHIVIEEISALDSTDVGEALKFAFFKGIDAPADDNNISSQVVAGGVPTGTYRMCSINTSANHVPVLAPVAQHTSLDDCIYFIAKSAGKIASEQGQQDKAAGKSGSKSGSKKNHKGGKRHKSRSQRLPMMEATHS